MTNQRNKLPLAVLGMAAIGAFVFASILPSQIVFAKKDKQLPATAAEKAKKLTGQIRTDQSAKKPYAFLATKALAANDTFDLKNTPGDNSAAQGTLESDFQLHMPNTILMPENPSPTETPAPSPSQAPVPTPTPASMNRPQNKKPAPKHTPAVQAQTTSQKELAMNLPLKEAASQVLNQVTTDLPSIPSQPIIDALSQSSNFTDYYSRDRLDKKTMYNFLALAAFLGALGLLFMSGALENLRNRNKQTQSFASGITPSEL